MYIPITRPLGTNSDEPLRPVLIGPQEVRVYWESIEPFIARSVKRAYGTLTVDYIQDMLFRGYAVAFLTMRGEEIIAVLICDRVFYATYTSIRVIACAGQELKEAVQFMDILDAWAISQGAVEIEAWCRPAMVRLSKRLGWTPKFTIVTRDLRRRLQ